jgi:hypothetical protein
MAELVDDFKISNVEITNELGINLTSDTSRIKHTGNDEFNISSSGEINIRTETKNGDNDNDINLYAGDGSDNNYEDTEGGDIRLYAGDGGQNGDGGDIIISAGDGNDNDGGDINVYAGDGDDGGYIRIEGGYGSINGGTVTIEAGEKYGNNTSRGAPLYLFGGYVNGNAKGGNVELRAGYGSNGYGDIKISYGPEQKIGFFGNTPVIRPASNGETAGVVTYPEDQANLRHESTFTGNLGDKAYTISDIVKALKQLGLLDTFNAAPGLAPSAQAFPQPRSSKPKKDKNKKRMGDN